MQVGGKRINRTPENSLRRQQALSRWDNEGGALPSDPHASSRPRADGPPLPKIANAELEELHIRVIALENLVIALLAAASDRQLELASRDGDLHISQAGLYASSTDDACGPRHGQYPGASFPFPQRGTTLTTPVRIRRV